MTSLAPHWKISNGWLPLLMAKNNDRKAHGVKKLAYLLQQDSTLSGIALERQKDKIESIPMDQFKDPAHPADERQ